MRVAFMRPSGFGGSQFRPPSASTIPAFARNVSSEQASPDLLSPPGSIGPQQPAQNGWAAPGSNVAVRPVPPPFGTQKSQPANLAGMNNLSLNGGPAPSAQYYSKPPVGGGEYVQQPGRQQPAALPPPRQAAAPEQSTMSSRAGRGPPAFGKPASAASAVGPSPSGPGSIGRPASPSSPNKYASIPMPASPSPTTSGRPGNPLQQQSAQMPLPPSQSHGLAPPSFSRPQQVQHKLCISGNNMAETLQQ